MNKFVELTEVIDAGGHYSPKSEKINYKYRLRSIYINPSHVACIEENETLKQLIQKEDIIPGLEPSIASFSTITINSQPRYRKVEVIGNPKIILSKIKGL